MSFFFTSERRRGQPVDRDGRELGELPVIDQQLAVDPKSLDARSMSFEEEVLGRILLGAQEHADVAEAVELAGGEEGCLRLIDEVVSQHPRFAGRPLREALDRDWFSVQPELVNLTLEAIEQVVNEQPGSLRLDRVSLEALMNQPWLFHERHIRSALQRGDYNDAAVRALARIQDKQAIAPELLLEILVGMDLKAVSGVFLVARSIPGELLGERLRHGAFGARTEDVERGLCAALAMWKTVPPGVARPLLVPFLRRAATALAAIRDGGAPLAHEASRRSPPAGAVRGTKRRR